MKFVLSAEQMRNVEKRAFDAGLSSLSLMETAAQCLADEIWNALGPDGKTCVFACGTGGNGGDGYAAARLFAKKGGRAIVVSAGAPKHPDAITNYELAKHSAFACVDLSRLETLPTPDAWADCIYGIGLNRAPEGASLELIRRMNADRAKGARVFACDIPSGLMADTGEIPGDCVIADTTLSLGFLKRGQLIGRGMDVCGTLKCADIGLKEEALPGDAMRLVENADVAGVLPARRRSAHKNEHGHLLIVAGSVGMAGAAALCAGAALRSGAGLVTVACPKSIVNILQILEPCAMCLGLPEKDGALSLEAADEIARALQNKSAAAIGPGLSLRADPACVRAVLECGLPAVIDADALNLIASDESLKALLSDRHAITPHPGEGKRLLGGKTCDQADMAARLHAFGCATLVKGAASVVCGEGLYLSASGCPGMAKGGSGDALTGIAAGLLAQGLAPTRALWAASQLHGLAGEEAQARFTERAMLPTDLIACIGKAFEKCAK